MRITHHGQWPEPLYQAIMAQQQHSVGEAAIFCTGLIEAPLIAWMWRNEREQVVDAVDRWWTLYGSLAHAMLEGYAGAGYPVETEAFGAVP